MLDVRRAAVALLVAMVPAMLGGAGAVAAPQNDAGTGGDAGNTFETATAITPRGFYEGTLDASAGDVHDYYRFSLTEGSAMSLLVRTDSYPVDPVQLLDPDGVPVDTGTRVLAVGVAHSGAFTSEPTTLRLAVHRARTSGQYRLKLSAEHATAFKVYSLCFMNCEGIVDAPQDLIFGGSLPVTRTRVLLVPPAHGDLGNPAGPTVVDYIDATLRGIHGWTKIMRAFTKDYPQYAYLRQITVEVEIFDGIDPVDPAGYEVIIGYVAAGPAFRGVATDAEDGVQTILDQVGIGDQVHFSGRAIALSLFGSSPRAGQVLYDFPEVNDLEVVTFHEFGHTFGLGHTRTWHPKLGPDLMNSPAPFIYGDNFPFGDGGERTKMKCLSSLNLYGMAVLYRWIPSGKWVSSGGSVRLPTGIPYKWYC